MVKNPVSISKGKFGYRKGDRELVVLDNIDLECAAGELIGIAGVNGSGKSTFIRSLCALQPALGGKILINGKDPDSIGKSGLAREVSMVLTEKISGFNLNCYDAVAAGRLPYTDLFHRLKEHDKKIIDAAMKVLGLEKHKDKLLSELSDGLYQKTMIARAVAQQTGVMVLDEPGAFLDFASKHELFIMLARLASEENKCILVSSHELDLLLKYCSRLILVKNGSFFVTAPASAKDHPVFKELSGGFI